mmetsp:Transcript_84025/g.151665  ORF Transcript_84025/g.151665 Transcript_84025/m.151665 type:complete len:209 (-) Transcript_84025:84-710(-)
MKKIIIRFPITFTRTEISRPSANFLRKATYNKWMQQATMKKSRTKKTRAAYICKGEKLATQLTLSHSKFKARRPKKSSTSENGDPQFTLSCPKMLSCWDTTTHWPTATDAMRNASFCALPSCPSFLRKMYRTAMASMDTMMATEKTAEFPDEHGLQAPSSPGLRPELQLMQAIVSLSRPGAQVPGGPPGHRLASPKHLKTLPGESAAA